MPVLSRVSPDTLETAKALRGLYKPAVPPKPHAEGRPAELTVTIASPVFDRVSIGFTLDGAFAGEEPFVPRTAGRSLGALAAVSGRRTLGVQVHGSGRMFHFTGPADVPLEGKLRVEVWSRIYPPRLLLDGHSLNPGPGLRYAAAAGAPCPRPGPCPLVIVDSDAGTWDAPDDAEALSRTLQVWIDDEPAAHGVGLTTAFTVPLLCRAGLSPGLHRVRIGDPLAGRVLLDTDIILDGAHEVRIDVSRRQAVAIREAGQVVFRQEGPEPPFRQGAKPTNLDLDPDREINGIPLPPGIEGHLPEIEEKARFSRAMVENFQLFKDLKASARRKKAAGEALTPEEQAVDPIETYDAMDEWIRKRKLDEYGWVLGTVATTNMFGEVEYVAPPPKDPFEELCRREALEIHEASHVLDTDVLSLEYDLDLRRLARYWWIKLRPARELKAWFEAKEKAAKAGLPEPDPPPIRIPGMDPEERSLDRWYNRNFDKIQVYEEAMKHPERGASAEIREYTADAEFWEAVLEYLRGRSYGWVVSDMALNLKPGESRPIRVEQIPDAPPQVRVIEGDAVVEVAPTERTHDNATLGWGQFDITVTGKAPGRARIELTCGTLRKVIVINVS